MKRWIALLALLLVTLAGRVAGAGPIELRAKAGSLPVELQPQTGSFGARLVVENRGAEPLELEVSLREGGETDPRLPVGMRARFVDGGKTALLKPGEQREIEVELTTARGRRLHEVYGHVLLKADDHPQAAAGFHLAPPGAEAGPAGRHLSLIWLVPLLGALVLFALRGREPRPGAGRMIWVGASGGQVALWVWAVSRFDPFHTRFAGGDGAQLVERLPLLRGLGLEYALGVDGTTLALASSVALVGLLAALVSEDARAGGFSLLIVSGVTGALLALDLGLMLASWLVAVVAGVLALAATDRQLARGAALVLGLGFVLVAFAVWQLSGTATPALALDGSAAPRVFSLLELSHGGYVPRVSTVLGAHPVKVVYTCLFLGSALTLGVAPFGGWLAAAAARAPASLALLLGGAVTVLGVHALYRIGFAAVPNGAAWAAPAVAVFGVAGTAYASLVALATDDARRFPMLALSASAGAILVGVASLTAAGLQGALLIALCRGLTLTLCFGALAMRRDAPGSRLVVALGVVAWVAAAAGPGTLAFTGALSSIVGALPTLRGLALAEAFALVLLSASAVRSFRRAFSAPGGGAATLPPEREMSAALTAAILLLVLGLWPRPLLRLIDSSCLDHAQRVNPPGALEIVRQPPVGSQRLAMRR